jgi:hypothetical protein
MPSRFPRTFLEFTALLGGAAGFWSIIQYFERRERRRESELVRSILAVKRCERCGGKLGEWDGRYHHGDVHFYDGGYLSRVIVRCLGCSAKQVFYLNKADQLLMNREVLFRGLFPEEDDT